MGEHSSDTHLTPVETEIVMIMDETPVSPGRGSNQSSSTSGRRSSPHVAHEPVRQSDLQDTPDEDDSPGAIVIHFKAT